MNRDEEHREEMRRRAERRAARSARTAEEGPSPKNMGPARTTTDAVALKAAEDRRVRKNLRRLQMKARTVEFGS